MALPNFRINPYVQPYVGGITDEFRQGVDQKIKSYEAALDHEDVLGYQKDTLLQNIGPFQNDIQFANQLIDDTRKTIEDRAQRGDYENMMREVKRSTTNFAAQAQPLLTNKKLYDEYRTQLAAMKDVDEVTKNKALQYSVANYKGINPSDPSTSMFRGFTPADTINVAETLDKFYTGWKADKGSRDVINADGTISKITWEQAQKGNGAKSGPQIMQEAGESYIKATPAISDYVNTQLTVGNEERLQTEIQGALSSNLQKHYYSSAGNEIGFVPEWMTKKPDSELPIYSSPSSVTDNIHVVNKFDGAKLIHGNIIADDQYYWRDGNTGNFFKYKDRNGQVVTKASADALLSGGRAERPRTLQEAGLTVEAATPREVAIKRNEDNKAFDKLVIDTFADDFAPAPYQNDQEAKVGYAKLKLGTMNSTELKAYRTQVLDRYNSMQKNVVVETQKWNKQKVSDVKLVGDIEQISDVGVLASSLGGREVQLMTKLADVDINLVKGNDINELYKQLGDQGWKPVKLNDNGLLKYNPKMDVPGSSVTLKIQKGTGEDTQYRDLEIAVGVGNADQVPRIQYLQKVMQQALSGNSGFVEIQPNSKAGYYVNVTPGVKTPEGKIDRRAKIIRIDSDGNQLGGIPVDAFPDYYMLQNPTANQELRRLITNPNPKK